jgi:PAS domain S-box-containing protein
MNPSTFARAPVQADPTFRLFDALSLAVAVLDARGVVVYANTRAREWAGLHEQSALADLEGLLGAEAVQRVLRDLPRTGSAPRPAGEAAEWAIAPGERTGGGVPLRLRWQAWPGALMPWLLLELHDDSARHERDMARLQLGALMNATGVGVATYRAGVGWLRDGGVPAMTVPGALADAEPPQAIGRDVVEPSTMGEFDRLQDSLRHGERVAARYAVRHADVGMRWLLTRVEPGQLASGEQAMTVVTLDVTEQEQARARNEQLLRELTTLLDSSSTGIAYLRGDRLVRCNQRFERVLGYRDGELGAATLAELLLRLPDGQLMVDDALRVLEDGAVYETEFLVPGDRAAGVAPRWYSLAVRRMRAAPGGAERDAVAREDIAVLTEVTRLKSQQLELERLARDRELMFNLSEVGIAMVRDGRIEVANSALARLTGWTSDELIGLDPMRLFDDRVEAQRIGFLQRQGLLRSGSWSGEHRMARRDGGVLWVQASLRLLHEGDAEGGVLASYVNVTERREAQDSLMQQADRTRAILDSVLVGIVTVERGGIEWMNRSARRMFGGALSDFFGLPIDTVATDDAAHPFRQVESHVQLEVGQAHTFECQIRARDGRQFWVAGNVVATQGPSGQTQLTYALLDIDRRREAEARSAQSQASLARIIESAPLAITLRDARDLRVLQINQIAADMLGRTVADCLGRTPEELMPAADAARVRADMNHALASQQVTRREYCTADPAGMRTWDARYLPLVAADGSLPDQLLMVASDVTEQRVAEQARLDAAIEQRELLVKEVHHRIKNNLQGVAGLLQQTAHRRPDVAPVIAEAVAQVQAIAQVHGLQVRGAGPLRLVNLVEAIVRSVERLFGCSIALVVAGEQPHRWMVAEAEAIPIALTLNELLTNAIKHAHVGGAACTLDCGHDGVRLSVRNAGRLPDGFDLGRVATGVSGLGLVRALLPRRSAHLSLSDVGDEVLVALALTPPSVTTFGAA